MPLFTYVNEIDRVTSDPSTGKYKITSTSDKEHPFGTRSGVSFENCYNVVNFNYSDEEIPEFVEIGDNQLAIDQFFINKCSRNVWQSLYTFVCVRDGLLFLYTLALFVLCIVTLFTLKVQLLDFLYKIFNFIGISLFFTFLSLLNTYYYSTSSEQILTQLVNKQNKNEHNFVYTVVPTFSNKWLELCFPRMSISKK